MTITWRNIDSPDFRSVQAGISEASRLIGGAFDKLGSLANQQRQLNIASEELAAKRSMEEATAKREMDTQAALNSIAGLDSMDAYKAVKLDDILKANPLANQATIRNAFLDQEKRVRDLQEMTPDQRLEWNLAQKFIDQDVSNQMAQLNQQKQAIFDRYAVDETLAPSVEVKSLKDVQQYLNNNVTDDWKFFGWFRDGINRTDATEQLPSIIQEAHQQMLKRIPESQRAAYAEINPQAAQMAVESALLHGNGRISFENIAENYIDYVGRLEKNNLNRNQRNLAQQQLLERSTALQRKAQDSQVKALQQIRGY